MIFAAGSLAEDVEEKIRHALTLMGGTLEVNGITCMKGHVLDVMGKYIFNRAIPRPLESRKRGFDNVSMGDSENIIESPDHMRNFIEMLLGSEDASARAKTNEKLQSKSNRPDNWRVIAEHAVINGNQATMTAFPEVCMDKFGTRCKTATIEMRLMRWIKDYHIETKTNTAVTINHGGRKPVYGDEIDNRLLGAVRDRMANDQPVNVDVLHDLLVAELQKEGLNHLLREEGGSCTFGVSWAQRFFNRHHLKTPKQPHKRPNTQRLTPAEAEEKAWNFDNALALTVADYGVPPALVFTMDEVPVVFSPSVARIKSIKAASSVQLSGVTKDKTQVTTTLCCNERGDVLPPQLIFGGTTERCHPKDVAPFGGFYSHSTTHWQTPETLISWIDMVLVPFKNTIIAHEGHRLDQHAVLVLDLHFSHKDIAVQNHLHAHNILAVYLPSGLSDDLQTINVAAAKAFQAAAKNRFKAFIHEQFNAHVDAGRPVHEFPFNFNVGFLKPVIPRCIESGMEMLHSAEMRLMLAQTFAKQGRMERCRDPNRVAIARATAQDIIKVPAEVEGDPTGGGAGESDDEM